MPGHRPFPFTAIVGQSELCDALLWSAIDPSIGGVLIYGDRGTGKTTAVRALADLLPKQSTVVDCPYNRSPDDDPSLFPPSAISAEAAARDLPVPVVTLPLGATEDRLLGALDIERALRDGEKAFEPGLLARANRGFLYIDEVNLLDDHLVDLLLDVATSGVNLIEREGLSLSHPARFVLVGSGNPEEGDLRPQLLDRFGLCVDVRTPEAVDDRIAVIEARDAYDRDPAGFHKKASRKQSALRKKIVGARTSLADVDVPRAQLEQIAGICSALGTDGLRGELTLMRAARAHAALDGKESVAEANVRRAASPALAHRLRRDPLDDARPGDRVSAAVDAVLSS